MVSLDVVEMKVMVGDGVLSQFLALLLKVKLPTPYDELVSDIPNQWNNTVQGQYKEFWTLKFYNLFFH